MDDDLEELWEKVNSGDTLATGEMERLKTAEGDETETALLKETLLNRYLLLQQSSIIHTLLEAQRMQTEELERLTDAEDLPLGERLEMVEGLLDVEEMDSTAEQHFRNLFFGAEEEEEEND